jgi:hypothetical protein
MTNLEKIQNFDVDEMAEFLNALTEETEAKFLRCLDNAGIDASIVKIPPKIQIEIHKKYLLKEVTENE